MIKRFLKWYKKFGILNFGFSPIDDFAVGPVYFCASSVWFCYFRFALYVRTPWWNHWALTHYADIRQIPPKYEPYAFWTFSSRRQPHYFVARSHTIYPR